MSPVIVVTYVSGLHLLMQNDIPDRRLAIADR